VCHKGEKKIKNWSFPVFDFLLDFQSTYFQMSVSEPLQSSKTLGYREDFCQEDNNEHFDWNAKWSICSVSG
jgi:hypothetical protein